MLDPPEEELFEDWLDMEDGEDRLEAVDRLDPPDDGLDCEDWLDADEKLEPPEDELFEEKLE